MPYRNPKKTATYQARWNRTDAGRQKNATRKERQRARELKVETYWKLKLFTGRDVPSLIKNASPAMVERMRVRIQKTLTQRVETMIVPAGSFDEFEQ